MTAHVLTFRVTAQRRGKDAVRSAEFWIARARYELGLPALPGHASPLELCVNRALHAIDALMMALGVSERPA